MIRTLILLLFPICCFAQRERDTVRVVILYSDTFKIGEVRSEFAYSVREKHNTSEGINDPGFYTCTDDFGHMVSCYHDYWVHVEYLDEKKKPLSKNILVWQQK